MAFPATHVRFAMDLAPFLSIQDLPSYYAGSLYPDSRYFTQVAREATHGPNCPHDPFAAGLTDFERGWATHLLYDETVGAEMQAIIPATYPRTRADSGMDDWWACLTALKALEDLQSCAQSSVLDALRSAMSDQHPCGEDPAQLREYYGLIAKKVYPHTPTWERYVWYMSHLHVPEHRANQFADTGRWLSQDQDLLIRIADMYPRQLHKTTNGK